MSPIPKIMRLASLLVLVAAAAWPVAAPAQPVNSPADWDLRVAAGFKGRLPVKSEGALPDDDNYAWQAARFLEGYLALARVTGDRKYMNDSREILDYMLSNRDDLRFAGKPLDAVYSYAPTYYLFHRGTPAKGWRRKSGPVTPEGPSMGVSVLIDGRVCEMFIQWCELARQGFPGVYEADVARYLDRVQETIEMHLPSFSSVIKVDPAKTTYHATLPDGGFRHWWHVNTVPLPLPPSDAPRTWSGQIPLNHSCTMARAMLGYDSLTGTTTYKANVQAVVNFYLNSLDPSRPSIAAWMYSPLDGNGGNLGKWEDVNHATVTLSLIEEAYRIGGYGITGAHVSRLVRTFHTFYNTAAKDVDNFIDGSGAAQGSGPQTASIATKSWLWLSQFDPAIATLVRDTYNQYYTANNSAQVLSGWANLLYWDSLIAGTAAFDDTSVAATRPLYNDTVNLFKYPYYVQTTASEVTGGAPEGTKQTQVNYTITSATGSASALYQFSPVEDFLVWGGVRLAYKNTGAATWSLLVIDSSSNTMRIDLPTQAVYAERTLRWSDFTHAATVNKSSVNKLRFQTVSSPLGSTGQFSFDDIRLVP